MSEEFTDYELIKLQGICCEFGCYNVSYGGKRGCVVHQHGDPIRASPDLVRLKKRWEKGWKREAANRKAKE